MSLHKPRISQDAAVRFRYVLRQHMSVWTCHGTGKKDDAVQTFHAYSAAEPSQVLAFCVRAELLICCVG